MLLSLLLLLLCHVTKPVFGLDSCHPPGELEAGHEQLDDEGSCQNDVPPATLEVVLSVEEAPVTGEQELSATSVGEDLKLKVRRRLILKMQLRVSPLTASDLARKERVLPK